jgi:hypothetical protein
MNWIVLRALNNLYQAKTIDKGINIMGNIKAKALFDRHLLLPQGSKIVVNSDYVSEFQEEYKRSYLENYLKYSDFLKTTDVHIPSCSFEEEDIKKMMVLKQEIDEKNESTLKIISDIIQFEESVRGVSRMFFRSEKYLGKREALLKLFKRITGIKELSNDKDQQYIYKLTNPDKDVVVLCENLDLLRRHTRPLNNKIELWYAGGKNTPKLERERQDLKYPIYYSCDWDDEGLKIYESIKRTYFDNIVLLNPVGRDGSLPKGISCSQDDEHESDWDSKKEFSGLDKNLYSSKQIELINRLIKQDEWLCEEYFDVVEMINTHY